MDSFHFFYYVKSAGELAKINGFDTFKFHLRCMMAISTLQKI